MIDRLRLNWVFGSLFILIFAFLLIVRLGVFENRDAEHEEGHLFKAQPKKDRETWMNILQQGKKIGYAHRQFYKTVEGYTVVESVFMQMNVMGMVQDMRFKTEGNFHSDLTLSSFDFDLQSSLFRFKARGTLNEKTLTLFAGEAGSPQKIDISLEKKPSLSVALLEALNHEDLKAGEHRTFHIFDPATMTQRSMKVSVLDEEMIPIMGRQEKARKLSVEFMGVPQFAWIGQDGTVLREDGSLGIRLERVTKDEALNMAAPSNSADLTEIASIPGNQVLHDVDQLEELRIRIHGVEGEEAFVNGGRQSLKGGMLMIRKESISNLPSSTLREKRFADGRTYVESSPFIQSDHPEIQALVKEVVSMDDPAPVRAKKLVAWVHEKIQKRPVFSVPNALETLRNRMGDCNEHAVLLAALARASGIPAQVESGLVYQRGRFYYHAWNVFYLGTWITADSSMGQFPADVTHIRFVRGTEKQIDLVRFIGRVRLEILSHE